MRVQDSQAYRKMDVTREHISHILELSEILLSFQTGFNLVEALLRGSANFASSSSSPDKPSTSSAKQRLVIVLPLGGSAPEGRPGMSDVSPLSGICLLYTSDAADDI